MAELRRPPKSAFALVYLRKAGNFFFWFVGTLEKSDELAFGKPRILERRWVSQGWIRNKCRPEKGHADNAFGRRVGYKGRFVIWNTCVFRNIGGP